MFQDTKLLLMIKKMVVALLLCFLFSCAAEDKSNYISNGNGTYRPSYTNFYLPEQTNKTSSQIVINMENIEGSFNPFYKISDTDYLLSAALYTRLFIIDNGNGSITPHLASEYTVSPDKSSITINLKQNFYFSDGNNINAADVIASLKLIDGVLKDSYIDKRVNSGENRTIFQLKDNYTIEITTSDMNALLNILAEFPIFAQRDIDQKFSTTEQFNRTFTKLNLKNIAFSGPYTFNRFDRTSVTLSPNTSYTSGYILHENRSEIKLISVSSDQKVEYDISYCEQPQLNNFVLNEDEIILDTGVEIIAIGLYNPQLFAGNKSIETINRIIRALSPDSNPFNGDNQVDSQESATDAPVSIVLPNIYNSEKLFELFDNTFLNDPEKISLNKLPFNDYIDNLFYIRDKDIIFIYINPSFEALLDSVKTHGSYFNQEIADIINNAISHNHQEVFSLLDNLADTHAITPPFYIDGYYLIKKNIYNFKLNSTNNKKYDIVTLENLIKIE